MTPAFHHADPGTPESDWLAAPGWDRARAVDADALFDGVRRLVVLAAHPDDETLGAGGLTALAAARGVPVEVVVATDGEASHPGSAVTPADLARLRRDESRHAATLLGDDIDVTFLGLPDGRLAEHADAVRDALAGVLDGTRPGAVQRPTGASGGGGASEAGAAAHAPEVGGAAQVGATLVACPWERDGHPDHDALGALTAQVCAARGVRLLRYPIWAWHWGRPDEFPWESAFVVPLDAAAAHAKHAALAAHATQVAPLVAGVDEVPLLGEPLLARHRRLVETFVVDDADGGFLRSPAPDHAADGSFVETLADGSPGTIPGVAPADALRPGERDAPVPSDALVDRGTAPAPETTPAGAGQAGDTDAAAPFDAMYDAGDDPWHDDAFYERRKRALVLAALGRERYGRILEIGCATGTLGAELATRAVSYLGLDVSERALAIARERHGSAAVRFELGQAPGAVPAGPFDLVVLSEVGYFLRADALLATLRAARRALAEGGEILLCHWAHPTVDIPLDGPLVHDQAATFFDLPHRVAYRDNDVRLDVWGAGPSVAAADGLV